VGKKIAGSSRRPTVAHRLSFIVETGPEALAVSARIRRPKVTSARHRLRVDIGSLGCGRYPGDGAANCRSSRPLRGLHRERSRGWAQTSRASSPLVVHLQGVRILVKRDRGTDRDHSRTSVGLTDAIHSALRCWERMSTSVGAGLLEAATATP